MKRKEFIKTCGLACVAGGAISMLFPSCVSAKSITAPIVGEGLIVPKSEFMKDGKPLSFLIVRNESLAFPIGVFHHAENDYSALLLRCTHQGQGLRVYGDVLTCSAHGSEFDKMGQVLKGPATEKLRNFKVITEPDNVKISLKKS